MKLHIVLGISFALAACGEKTEPLSEEIVAPSANAEAQLRPASNPALLSGYVKRPVKGPGSWRELNDRQSPNYGGAQ